MPDRCSPEETRRRGPVTRAVALWLLVALPPVLGVVGSRGVQAEDVADVERRLLLVAREDVDLSQRLAAAARVLAARQPLEAELAVRAGSALLEAADEPAGWLVLRGLDSAQIRTDLRESARESVAGLLARLPVAATARRGRLAALGMLLGLREPRTAESVTTIWPPPDFVAAVLRREIGELRDADGTPVLAGGAAEVRSALEAAQPAAAALDDAVDDDPARMRRGLDGLVRLGDQAVPLLLHEAEMGVRGEPRGRMPRVARAVLALGFLGDRRATAVLAHGLTSEAGWVRVACATALGDLGDPAGAVPLAVHCATLGDRFRARDQWDWPGASDTEVKEADWGRVDYFVVDVAAADALLRLGIPGAAGYLIHEKLDPSRSNFRIRVLQDAVDALRRSVPPLRVGDPEQGYNVDAGLPQRDAAFSRLAFAWHVLRDQDDLLPQTLDETDPGFRRAARALTERLRGTDVRAFMITKPACALLGRCMTPTLIETLAAAKRGSAVAELAETLGLVRDLRAVPPLLALLRDERDFVRARAAEALASYVARDEAVRKALIALLADSKDGPRVSALKGLMAAPPSDDILAAVEAHSPRRRSKDWTMAETALRLVQEGAQHWPAVARGLASEHRYEREAWWRHLRTALDWPEHLHDARVAPGTPHARRVTEAQVLARLAQRRSP